MCGTVRCLCVAAAIVVCGTLMLGGGLPPPSSETPRSDDHPSDSPFASRVPAGRAGRLLCLMYHRFVDDSAFNALPPRERAYAMPIGKFAEQLGLLRSQGYASVSLSEAAAFVRGEWTPPGRAVLITIDDGCRSALTRAAPVLMRHGMTATLFVTTGADADVFRAGQGGRHDDPRMTDSELRAWTSLGFDAGSHGVTHRGFTELSDEDLLGELTQSRQTLEALLNRRITAAAAPRGRCDARVRALAARAGYVVMFTSRRGDLRPGDDVLDLPRRNISGQWSRRAFLRVIGAMEPAEFHDETDSAGASRAAAPLPAPVARDHAAG